MGVSLLTLLPSVRVFHAIDQKSPVASPSVYIALREHRRQAKVAQRPRTTACARRTAASTPVARESDLHSPDAQQPPSSRGEPNPQPWHYR